MTSDGLVTQKTSDLDPKITMTEAALKHARRWLRREKAEGLRLSTKVTGCSGLEYVISLVYEIDTTDLISKLDDDITIYVAASAFYQLRGSKLDYVKDGLNQKFVFENPNAKGVCGCGESFTINET